MTSEPVRDETQLLLRRMHTGDRRARDELIARNLSWVRQLVERRLGPKLRRKDETDDLVQSTMREFLRYGPQFELANQAHFRSLLAKIVENVLRQRHEWFTRKRRDLHREVTAGGDGAVQLDALPGAVTAPSERASRAERKSLVWLALELLDPVDREIVIRREFDKESFAEIGAAVGMSEDAAGKRFQRALPKLGRKYRMLIAGEIQRAVQE